MRKLVNNGDLRVPGDDSLRIHLLKKRAAIFDFLARHHLQTLRLGDRVLAPVWLEIPDDHIDTLGLEYLRFLKHLVGLADTGCVSEIDLELPALARRSFRARAQQLRSIFAF